MLVEAAQHPRLRQPLKVPDNPAMPTDTATKTAIATKDAPAAIGPYTQAIRTGDFLFTSGQIALDPATGQMSSGDITEQTERVIANLRGVLTAAGLSFAHVVKTTVFLKDMRDFAAMNDVYGRAFAAEGTVAPARSTVQVAELPKDALVEIDCIARA
jgi:2-iminobutanoate/2-iminopropanoate deaminase